MPLKKKIRKKAGKFIDEYTLLHLYVISKLNGNSFTDPKKPRKVSSKDQEALLSKLDVSLC